jgi:hypothetical protein
VWVPKYLMMEDLQKVWNVCHGVVLWKNDIIVPPSKYRSFYTVIDKSLYLRWHKKGIGLEMWTAIARTPLPQYVFTAGRATATFQSTFLSTPVFGRSVPDPHEGNSEAGHREITFAGRTAGQKRVWIRSPRRPSTSTWVFFVFLSL